MPTVSTTTNKNTFSNGCLGSHNDEERSEMRYVMRIAESSESSNFWTQLPLPSRQYVCWSVCSSYILFHGMSWPLYRSELQCKYAPHTLLRFGKYAWRQFFFRKWRVYPERKVFEICPDLQSVSEAGKAQTENLWNCSLYKPNQPLLGL